MSEDYYVISNSGGDTAINQLSKEELLERLEEKYWGDVKVIKHIDKSDATYLGKNILIIKGNAIAPQTKAVVTFYNV